MQSSLRAVLRKHEDDLLKSPQAADHQYDAGLMTVASPASETFDAFNVNSTLKHGRNKLFLKDKFWLGVVASRQHRLCTQKLATSGQSSTKWASQPIQMILIRAADSEVP